MLHEQPLPCCVFSIPKRRSEVKVPASAPGLRLEILGHAAQDPDP
jgi:hypothetical protein